jgi:hypothetical protein
MRFYVGSGTDTQLIGTQPTNNMGAINVTDPQTFYFGAGHRNDEAIVPMTGWLDEIKFFDHALTEAAIEECMAPSIPTVSEWGLLTMTVLVLAAGTMVVRNRLRTG